MSWTVVLYERKEDTMDQLWKQIQEFQIDEPDSQSKFVNRLARENGWTLPHARRVLEEYKKFVYMAMVSKHQVTPSEDVDQAWHLHLTYTVSYWEKLHVFLPRRLHHHPSKGGQSESDRMDDQYSKTMALYEQLFGHAAPKEIWPDPNQRFGHDLSWSRVNTQDHWIVPKAQVQRSVWAACALGLIAIAAGCAPVIAQVGATMLVGIIALSTLGFMVIFYLIGRASANGRRSSSSDGGDGGCDSGTMMMSDSSWSDSASSHGHHSSSGHGDSGHGGHGDSSDGSNGDSGGGDSGGGDGGGCGGGGCGGGGD